MDSKHKSLCWEAEFLGVHAHDCAFPWNKRDGTEAMTLAISGLQFLQMHVQDNIRISYKIQAASGTPGTISRAYAKMLIHFDSNEKLPENLPERIGNVVAGAGIMIGLKTELTPVAVEGQV